MELMEMTDDKGSPTIEARVKVLVMDHLGVSADRVVDSTRFEQDLGADSLDVTELMMGIEEHFMLEIDDEDAKKLHTVGEVVRYLEDRQAA